MRKISKKMRQRATKLAALAAFVGAITGAQLLGQSHAVGLMTDVIQGPLNQIQSLSKGQTSKNEFRDAGDNSYCERIPGEKGECEICYENGEVVYEWCEGQDEPKSTEEWESGDWCESYINHEGKSCELCYENGQYVGDTCDDNGIPENNPEDGPKDEPHEDDWEDDGKDQEWDDQEHKDGDDWEDEWKDEEWDDDQKWEEEWDEDKHHDEYEDDHHHDNHPYESEHKGDYDEYEDLDGTVGNQINAQKAEFRRWMKDSSDNFGWEMLNNRLELFIERFNESLKYRNEQIEMADDEGYDTREAEERVEEIELVIEWAEDKQDEVRERQDQERQDIDEIKSKIEALDEDSTWEEVDEIQVALMKMEVYRILLQALDLNVMVAENMEGPIEMQHQVASIYQQYAQVEMPDDVADRLEAELEAIKDLDEARDRSDSMYDKVEGAVNAIQRMEVSGGEIQGELEEMWELSEELNQLNEDIHQMFEEFYRSEPWQILDEFSQYGHDMQFVEDLEHDLESMEEQLEDVERFFTLMKRVKFEDDKAEDALDRLIDLKDKFYDLMVKMEDFSESGGVVEDPEKMEKFEAIMEQYEENVERDMDILIREVDENPHLLNNFSDEERELIKQVLYNPHDEDEDEHYDKFEETYAHLDGFDMDEFQDQVHEEAISEIRQNVPGDLMAEILPYMDGDTGESLTHVMNHMDTFGEQGATLLENTAEVYSSMDEIDDDYVDRDMRALFNDIEDRPISEKYKDDIRDAVDYLKALLDSDASDQEIEDQIDVIKDLLEKNQEELVLGEDPIEFYDVEFGEDWYYGSVISVREEGIINGYADQPGHFGPGDPVTNIQITKMVLEAADYGPTSATGDHWGTGYMDRAQELGLSIASTTNWDEAATRATVIRLIIEAFDIDTNDYDYANQFPDVSASDANAPYYAAAYELGIFMGDGDTGYLRPSDSINRAEAAKVIEAVLEKIQAYQTLEEEIEALDAELEVEVEESENENGQANFLRIFDHFSLWF